MGAPTARRVVLDPEAYTRILGGPPDSVAMHAGAVVLAPGGSVGEHDTGPYEELLVVLAGRGEFRLAGGPPLALEAETAAYCPPDTRHDVVNTGPTPLRYVYVAAKAR
jgi:quercetin dioxygenase-like cupin family protein